MFEREISNALGLHLWGQRVCERRFFKITAGRSGNIFYWSELFAALSALLFLYNFDILNNDKCTKEITT